MLYTHHVVTGGKSGVSLLRRNTATRQQEVHPGQIAKTNTNPKGGSHVGYLQQRRYRRDHVQR